MTIIRRSHGSLILWPGLFVCMAMVVTAAEQPPHFFRGLNLNGPAVTIDGHRWDGAEATNYRCKDKAFENQNVALVPPTDAERARMIRSSRWGGNRVELTDLPAGQFTVFLYVWEDNDSETFSVAVNGRPVIAQYQSGNAGHWERLGPWFTTATDGKIVVTSQGGAANFSGIELWRGHYDGLDLSIDEEQLTFFEKRIRPLLAQHCYECHSADAVELQGDLLLDSRATIRRGGVHGPAVIPGNLEKSLLIQAVKGAKTQSLMPPAGKLTETEIADLERWVQMGAPDPRTTATRHAGKQIDIKAARQFWSLTPLKSPEVPRVQRENWPRSPIDRFVLAEMESHGLAPAHDADKRALIRRATYDLTGLPPMPEDVAAFLADETQEAFARVVDRLLDSPRYGERWGRHWLDVVRYADTAGDNSDYPIPQMYRYRNWVIDAFNRDLPYDEFIRDQLAGDLRGGDTEDIRFQRIIATGYIANSRRFGSRVDDYPQHLTIEDTIDNLGRAFLGMSLSCARCHDHKFDPLTTQNYYGIYGVFSSTRYPWPGIELEKRQRDLVPLVPLDTRAQMEQAVAERAKTQASLDAEVKQKKDALKNASAESKTDVEQALKDAEQRAQEHRRLPPLFESAYAVADMTHPQDAAVQIKGDPARSGDLVPRHFPAVLGGHPLPDEAKTSGRMELAEWLISPENPLPARVMANRLWQHHFGQGLVPTPNDFGKQGKPPTHPALLDYLAVQFRTVGWSLKAMHRQIMLSRTYQLASDRDADTLATDPTNTWLTSYPRRRLDAESLRDTLLLLSGNLDLSPAGPHPFPAQDTWDFTQHKPFKAVYESRHRSVYLMTQRIQRHPYLAIFDGADPSTSTGRRMNSTTPLQSLYLLNDPFIHEQAQGLVRRILSKTPTTMERVQVLHQQLFARPASNDEVDLAHTFLSQATELLTDTPLEERESAAWQAYVRGLFRLNEFVYLD